MGVGADMQIADRSAAYTRLPGGLAWLSDARGWALAQSAVRWAPALARAFPLPLLPAPLRRNAVSDEATSGAGWSSHAANRRLIASDVGCASPNRANRIGPAMQFRGEVCDRERALLHRLSEAMAHGEPPRSCLAT